MGRWLARDRSPAAVAPTFARPLSSRVFLRLKAISMMVEDRRQWIRGDDAISVAAAGAVPAASISAIVGDVSF